MRNVSTAWKAKVQTGQDVVYLKYIDFTLADGTKLSVDNSDLWSNGFKFDDSVSEDDSFDIGSAIINSATITINNFDDQYTDYIFENARAVCYIGLQLDDRTIEKIRICTMTVTEAPYRNSVLITLSLEDDMRNFDKDYSASNLSYPATRLQIVQDVCNICGVTLQSTSFYRSDYIVQNRPNDDSLTCRQVLSWVAMLGCQWAKCDEYGRLVLDWYNTEPSDSDYTEINTTSGLTVNLEDVVITGVRVTEYSDSADEDVQPGTYLEGNEGYVIEISDNKLIGIGDGKTIASIIGDRVIGMKFRPLSANILTDVQLESGDLIKVTSSKGITYTTYITSLTLQPGLYESIANNAKSATRNSSKQYSQMTQIAVEARKNIQVEKSAREKAIEALGTRIDESSGVYTTEKKQADGSYIYYLHNKPTLADSDIVWKMTSEAWGVSTDGGKTYNAGMTIDGDTVVRILTATGVNADWISTGALSITDDNGNTIFEADIDNKTVTISGDHVTIGGKTATQAIEDANSTAQEALNAAALAKNMTMQLSNEYQAISVGNDGEYSSFPECTTKPVVMYGSQDITENCSFTFSKSDSVTGHWDSSTKTYTVTGLSADSGWVDIKATYINVLTVVKRFSLSKVYAGNDATADMKTYQLEASANIYKVVEDNLVEPDTITFSAYCRTGEDATLSEYKGRFVIEGTEDGNDWVTLYTSEKDESSAELLSTSFLMYWSTSLVLMYADADDGTFLYTDKPLSECTNVRCKLYAAGGTDTLLDQIVIDKVTDVAALTQEEIFNILTDNGSWKGIYNENGQMYISFTYAKGGTLVLGGADNVNGQLIIRDADGNQIGEWGKDGIVTEKGSFTGTVNAENGKIGGWTITDNTIYNGTEGTFNGTKYIDGVVLHADEPYLQFASTKLKTSRKGALMVDGGFKISLPSRGGFTDGGETNEFVIENLGSTTSGSSMVLDGTWVCYISSSSKRYKDIERDMTEEDINDLYGIQPVIAKYKDDYLKPTDERYQKTMPMFVAEDVEEHFPICANHNKDGTTEDWNMRIMIPAMFQMIKEQKKEIDKLTELVNNLLERSE